MVLTRLSFYRILGLAVAIGTAHAVTAAHAGDRLVVKYRPGFEPCVDCPLTSGAPSASVSASGALEVLHRELGVRGARPLFRSDRAARRSGVTAEERARRLRARFPARAQRTTDPAAVPDLGNLYVVELASSADLNAAAARYAAAPEVEWAHPDHMYSLNFVPNDPFFASSGSWGQSYDDLWGLHLTDAATAWETSSGSGVIVAVVDSGFDSNHADLGNLWTNAGEIAGNEVDDDGNGFVDDIAGWDFVSGDNTTEDLMGHGTHVAGTIAAAGDNGVGVVGMAWGSQIMPVRVFGTGSAPVSVVAEGIVYAAENGADVINASLSGPPTQIMADAVQTAQALGTIVVASAGNNATDAAASEPASLPGVIAVSASDSNDTPASFTNFGDPISVAAPGVDILSLQASGTELGPLVTDGYVRLSGTSMAAPHVAGLVALLLAAEPGLDQDEVRWHLELNADQPGVPGWETASWNPFLGYGRIDAGRVFDPPPATARLRPSQVERHVHAGGTTSLTDLTLSFTTHDPISWSVLAPAWIVPGTPSGIGPATVPLAIDGAGLTGGETLTGSVTADAPGLASSESLTANVHVHADNRSGAELPIEINSLPYFPQNPNLIGGPFRVRMASNGERVLMVWHKPTSIAGRLLGALVDEQGIVAGPFIITESNPRFWFDVASDGENFLVAWIENADDVLNATTNRRIVAARVLADGTLTPGPQLDPILIDGRSYRPYHLAYFPRVAFDGSDYIVAWQRRDIRFPDGRAYRTWVYFRRVSPDGTPWPKRKKLSLKGSNRTRPISGVDLACLPGRCLFTWRQDFLHSFAPLIGERVDYRSYRQQVYNYFFATDDFAAGNNDYLVVGRTSESCLPGNLSCVREVRGFRVDATGAPIDLDLIKLNQGTTAPTRLFRQEVAAAFDGTDYLVSFGSPATRAGTTNGTPVFLARLAPDGTLRDTEHEGVLVAPGDSAGLSAVSIVNGQPLVAWRDWRDVPTSGPGNAVFASVYAQPLAP